AFPSASLVSSSAIKRWGEEQARRPMKTIAIAATIVVAVAGIGGAQAQPYPSHPITIIVPFPAGGPTDTLARILSDRMRVSLGQPLIIATDTGARSRHDRAR